MERDDQKHTDSEEHPTKDSNPADKTVILDVPRELGCYRLTRLLGRGGMGEVWQAFDKHLERDVAIKLMRKELVSNEDATRRFAREARAVARLNHPNIVQVYAFGDEKGLTYFVMELVEGETITQRLKRQRCIPLEEAVNLTLQAVEGLAYASARGIIHRDIKPSNLMVTHDHRVKIADFGLAKMVEHDSQMTAAGTAMGSPNYMSPEQARGEEADHRSDIYALGVSLYQMLCGGLPFTASSPLSVLLKQIQEPLPEPEDLKLMGNGAVIDVLKKMTAKSAGARYQTYGELAAALAEFSPGRPVAGAHSVTASMAPASPPSGSPSPAFASSSSQAIAAATGVTPAVDPVAPAPPHKDKITLLIAAAALAFLLVAGVVTYLVLAGRNSSSGENPDPVTTASAAPPVVDAPASMATPSPASSPSPAVTATATPPAPAASASASPAVIAGTMQPLNINTNLPITPTPLPIITITPRPELAELLPNNIPAPPAASRNATGQPVPVNSPASTGAGSNAQGPRYVLGTAGASPGEMIPTFKDQEARAAYKTFPAGTEVVEIATGPTMMRVVAPDNQVVYIYKKMARLKR